MAFGHFLLDSHNYIVTALGSCVKWPLDYNEDVHQSRQLGEWSNMIGYKMGSSLVGILSTTKTSSSSSSFIGLHMRVLQRSGVLNNLKPLYKKLDLWRTPP